MNDSTTYCIYRIVNFRNGKVYVGLTCNSTRRNYEHFRLLDLGQHCNSYLQRSYKKYGRQAFYFEVIEQNITCDCIDEREKHWIAYFDSHANGYNNSPGGDFSYRGIACAWNGISYESVRAAAFACGVEPSTMRERFTKGYTCDSDVYAPGEYHNKPCVWNGVSYPSHKACAIAIGVSPIAMRGRLMKGYSCDDDMPQRIRCEWNCIKYKSLAHCSRLTGISRTTLARWLNSGYTCDEDVPDTYRSKQQKKTGVL